MQTFQRGGGEKNQDFMLISFFNPSDLIGCGGDINQSDGSMRRGYAEGVRGGGMRRGYAEGV